MSTRADSPGGQLGNQVAMWLVELPIDVEDPFERYEIVKRHTSELKETDQALGAKTLVDVASASPITVLSMANRLVGPRLRPFNMTVTNIPGPQFPMYLLESQMLANYPMVPLWAQHGVGIALFSYNGRLLWGIQADYDALPDSADLVQAIHRSYEELLGSDLAD